MREYEAMILVKPEFDNEQIDSFLDEIKEQIVQGGGKVSEAKIWKKKSRLAYEIKHYKEGIYLIVVFEISPENLEKLKKFFNLNEDILRFIFIKKEIKDK